MKESGMKEHIWQRNDTWERVSAAYRVPVCMIIRANRLQEWKPIRPGDKIRIPAPTYCMELWEQSRMLCKTHGRLRYREYIIAPGDSVYSIAKRFNTTMNLVLKENAIQDPRKIQPGRTLKIPCMGEGFLVYSVRTIDTIEEITRKFGISADEIARYNETIKTKGIYPGMQLVIPRK